MYDSYSYYSGVSTAMIILNLVIIAFGILITWRIFVKAGEAGWASLIPFYNIFVYYRVIWGSGAKMFLLLIPIYNIIFAIQTIFRTAKVFGKSTGFGFGLLFLSPVFLAILAFGNAQYVGGEGYRPQNADYQRQNAYRQSAQQPANYAAPVQRPVQQPANYAAPVQRPAQQPANYAAPVQQPAQAASGSKFCTSCGQKLDADAKFCPGCGAKQI